MMIRVSSNAFKRYMWSIDDFRDCQCSAARQNRIFLTLLKIGSREVGDSSVRHPPVKRFLSSHGASTVFKTSTTPWTRKCPYRLARLDHGSGRASDRHELQTPCDRSRPPDQVPSRKLSSTETPSGSLMKICFVDVLGTS